MMKFKIKNDETANFYQCCNNKCKLGKKFVLGSSAVLLTGYAIGLYDRSKILSGLKSITDYTMNSNYSLFLQIIGMFLFLFLIASILDCFLNKHLCDSGSRSTGRK